MMPSRVAMALQADGWYLRSMMPWVKRNSMPESVTDRPSTAVEYVFLLSKNPRYYWDADAVRVDASSTTHSRGTGDGGPKRRDKAATLGMHDGWGDATRAVLSNRNRRNSDWFLESWQGLLLDEDDDPLALVINPMPFKGAHFATFPSKLVEPMVKASTSEKGQCPECGAPWVRVTESHRNGVDWNSNNRAGGSRLAVGQSASDSMPIDYRPPSTTGWRPSCGHEAAPVPQTILDPFGGAGTVGLVADRLGRNAVLCELSESYSDMGTDRLRNDSPMFMDLEEA
jgi:hypothetical protein